MKKRWMLAATLLAAGLPQLALAHPGDHSETGFFHLFTSPYHIAAIVGLVALVGYFLARRQKEKVDAKEFKNKKKEL